MTLNNYFLKTEFKLEKQKNHKLYDIEEYMYQTECVQVENSDFRFENKRNEPIQNNSSGCIRFSLNIE